LAKLTVGLICGGVAGWSGAGRLLNAQSANAKNFKVAGGVLFAVADGSD
jgi:hypothetical protein